MYLTLVIMQIEWEAIKNLIEKTHFMYIKMKKKKSKELQRRGILYISVAIV